MSSGLMASAHMRMKQKREKHANMTSPSSAAKSVSSPSSTIASPTNNNMMTSPTNAASSVTSPRNSNSNNTTPVASAAPVSPGRMGSGGGGGSMPQQQQQQSQYSPLFKGTNNNNNNNGGGSGGRYQPTPPSPSYPTPLDSSPNRPMRKEEPFDSAIQHRGNYTHHLSPRSPQHGRPNRPRRGYDSYTESSKEEQEKFNRQYYQQLAQNAPPPPPPPGMPPQQQQQQQVAFDPFRPSPVTIPNGTTNTNDRMSPYFQDTQFQQAMMRQEQQQQQQQQQQGLMQDESGGTMMHGDYEYDTTEDEEAKDVVSPMTMNMMSRTTGGGGGGVDEEETISSEVALNGDPSGKKDKKKKKKKSSVGDARYLIHNVGSDDAMEKPPSASDPRYGIHLTGSNDDDDDDDEDEVYEDDQSKESSSINYRDIAAHAGRYVTRQEPQQSSPKSNSNKNTNPFDDNSLFDSKGGYLPKRIGKANSWDGDEGGGGEEGEGSKNDGANEGDGNNNVPVWNEGKKQRNMWEDDNSNTMQKFTRNSKSWDQENIDSFDANLWAGSSNGSFLPSGNTKDNNANDQTLAEWDKAEAEFQKKAQQEVTPPKDKELDSVMNKSYPWKAQQSQQQPTTYNGPSMDGGRVSDSEGSESDADSLFKFDKQKAAAANDESGMYGASTDPNHIFDKISQGLEQADNSRNGVAVSAHHGGGVGNESDGSYDQTSAYPGKSGENGGPTSPPRSVAFAGEAENKVHTYLVPQDQNSASDSGTYETRDDEEDDETDGDTLEENTLEDGDTIDNYTLDDATYGESTLGGGTIETGYTGNNTEGDIDILDHVDKAVAVIGSALGSFFLPKDQAPNSSTSIENDETIQNSTMGGSMEEEANAKGAGKSEYDWMGYMEKFLFPQDGEDGASTLQESTMRSASTSASATNSGEEGEDGDDYLLQQAMASAKAIHHIHGIQFDELQDINVLTDIKFVVVSVPLPLGLLFQEHEIGAWVSRTVPDGNGARKGIQPGDQLAAINGKSSVHATIDEVASIISSTPKNKAVELTFLRYVGPLRPVPGAIIQEGFEVTDKNVSSNKGKPKKGIFGLSKKTKTNVTPTSPMRPSGKASLEFTPNQKRSAKNLNTSTQQQQQQQQSATKSKSKQTTQKSPTSDKGKSPFKKIFGGKKKS